MPRTPSKVFHLTIGAGANSASTGLSGILEHDLRMLKVGLLYGDRVKLCSLTAGYLLRIIALTQLAPKQQIQLWEEVYPVVITDPVKRETLRKGFIRYHRIGHKAQSSKPDRLWRDNFRKMLLDAWRTVVKTIEDAAENAGAAGLAQAYQTGLVDLHNFTSTNTQEITNEYFDVVGNAISDGSTYPLFDDLTGALVRAAIREGKLEVSTAGVERGKHSGLAGKLLKELPTFDEASMDEVMDIRKDLDRYLVNFRAAMINFSEAMKNASWDEDFPFEVDKIYYRDVAPAVVAIEDAVKANNYFRLVARGFLDKPTTLPAGSALGWLISLGSSLPAIAAQTFGVGATAALVAYDSYNEWHKKQAEIEQNQLFFYYSAGKKLV